MMAISKLLTPAVPYTVTETETALGGQVPSFTAGATVWAISGPTGRPWMATPS